MKKKNEDLSQVRFLITVTILFLIESVIITYQYKMMFQVNSYSHSHSLTRTLGHTQPHTNSITQTHTLSNSNCSIHTSTDLHI